MRIGVVLCTILMMISAQVVIADQNAPAGPPALHPQLHGHSFLATDDLVHFEFNLEEPPSSISMNILIQTLGGIEYVEGSEIGCFTPDGLLAGATALYGEPESDPLPPSWGFAIWGDEPLTDGEIEGFTDGEALRFVFWDPINNWELDLDFAINDGDAVFRAHGFLAMGITVSVKSPTSVPPVEFGLMNIYPNPFNSQTIVSYSVPVLGQISLKLFDLNGRFIETVDNGVKSPGIHTFNLQLNHLPSGIYLLQMQNRQQVDFRKLHYVK